MNKHLPPPTSPRQPGPHMDTYRARNRRLELWLALAVGIGVALIFYIR